jgi:hypothetical protein
MPLAGAGPRVGPQSTELSLEGLGLELKVEGPCLGLER